MPQLHAFLPSLSNSKPFIHHNILWSSSSSSSSAPTRRRLPRSSPTKPPNLKSLTSRIVQLTRRRQLHQILEEIENAKIEYGNLNTIVMNVVMEACVHCGDVDLAMEACVHCGDVDLAINIFHQLTQPHSCGVDTVTYATLLEGLGRARRIDDAFQLLESVEKGTAAGKPKLSTQLIYGLLDALQVSVTSPLKPFLKSYINLGMGLQSMFSGSITRKWIFYHNPVNFFVKDKGKDCQMQETFAVLMVFLRAMVFVFVKEGVQY